MCEHFQVKGTGKVFDIDTVLKAINNSTDTTHIYRVMSIDEYKCIMANNLIFTEFEYAMEQKWFATSLDDVKEWQKLFYLETNSVIMRLRIKAIALDYMFYHEYLDNIGPAYCSSINLLNLVSEEVVFYE